MLGFAILSFPDNGIGGFVAQGLGTSMLQVPNLMKKPVLWLPPVITSAITTPIGPTRPEVPIPDEIAGPLFLIWNTQVAIGPVIADVITGGSQRTGFFIRFGT